MLTNNSKTFLTDILNEEDGQLRKLHQIVADTLREQELITQNLLNPPQEMLSRGQRVADKVAQFGGSWTFIINFGIIIIAWISFNILVATQDKFDPYPFILLNLVLSCLAALQAPIIMMSQNRQEEKDRKRAENDYLVNLKAEIEVRHLHEKLDLLMQEQFQNLMKIQKRQVEMLEVLCNPKQDNEN